MTSSPKEILEPLKDLIKLGIVGFDNGCEDEKYCNVTYNKDEVMIKVFSPRELDNLPDSKNMKEAVSMGLKTEDEILKYCKDKLELAKIKAIKTSTTQVYDELGLFSCKCKDEECSWDFIYAVVTPNGETLYRRKHCY